MCSQEVLLEPLNRKVISCAGWSGKSVPSQHPRHSVHTKLEGQNYLPPPRRLNFGRSRGGYSRSGLPVFSRVWVSTVDLGTQSSILPSGGGRQFCSPCRESAHKNAIHPKSFLPLSYWDLDNSGHCCRASRVQAAL